MSIKRTISERLLFTIHDSYYILLTLLNCSFLLSLGAGYWKYPITTAFILVMLGLQFLSKKFWFTTFLSFVPFYFIKLPLFPRLTNHGNLQVFTGILIVLFIVFNFQKIKKNLISEHTLRNTFIYPLVVVYVVAGFHKLNAGFFDLNFGCINRISSAFNSFAFGEHFVLSDTFTRLSQILTIIFEMIIPLGLLFKPTRKIALCLMVLFHFSMSLFGFSNFSAFAGFMLCGCIINIVDTKAYYKSVTQALKLYVFFSMASVLLSYFVMHQGFFNKAFVRVYNGIVFNFGWLIFFFTLISKTPIKNTHRKLNLVTVVLMVFLLIWGGQAYLGLSNAGNLTMFSNLKTEKSRSNHYLIDTNSSKIWSFEEDLVSIVHLPDYLKWQNSNALDSSYQLPLIEFKTQANNWVNQFGDSIALTVRYKNENIYIPNLKASEFSEVKWWYHYVYFRRITKPGINECLW